MRRSSQKQQNMAITSMSALGFCMNPYIELTRPSVWLLSVFGILVGGIVAGTASLTLQFVFAMIAAGLICAAGNVINDWFDFRSDRINAPHRPIPSGRVSRSFALYLYVLLGVIGIASAIFVSLSFFMIAIFSFIVASAYPWKLKRIPFVKNITVAWLATASFLAAGLISEEIPIVLLFLVLVSFLATLAREMVKDIEDLKGDKRIGTRTLPMVIGKRVTKMFAYGILAVACILLILPYLFGIFDFWYLVGIMPAVILCMYSATVGPHNAQRAIKIAMYFVLFGFLLGSFL
jgi:geranylgeranylglycerol-phosphate geranylgeranyltransferase